MNREEQIANAEKATVDSIREQRFAKTAELVKILGHPLHTFTLENEALAKTIEKCREALKNGHVEYKLIEEVRQLAIHYAKKGDLLYPHLKVKYEISGPSDVMWTVDDEIRDEFAALAKKADSQDDEWKKRFEAVLTRADEMIYKEANILFPNCAFNFTDEEWFGIYRDSKDYAECFGVENGISIHHAETHGFFERTGVGEADKIKVDEFPIRKQDDHSFSLVFIIHTSTFLF